jgi:hypothetical protein
MLERLRAARALLAPNLREAIRLHYDEELSYDHIADRMRKSSRTVEFLLYAGLRALRRQLCASHTAKLPRPPMGHKGPQEKVSRKRRCARGLQQNAQLW